MLHGPAVLGYGDLSFGLLSCWPKDAFVQALDSVSVTSSCGILRSRLSLFLIADFRLTFG
jgi:hypothetical protein